MEARPTVKQSIKSQEQPKAQPISNEVSQKEPKIHLPQTFKNAQGQLTFSIEPSEPDLNSEKSPKRSSPTTFENCLSEAKTGKSKKSDYMTALLISFIAILMSYQKSDTKEKESEVFKNCFYYITKSIEKFVEQRKLSEAGKYILELREGKKGKKGKVKSWRFSQYSLQLFVEKFHGDFSKMDWSNIQQNAKLMIGRNKEQWSQTCLRRFIQQNLPEIHKSFSQQQNETEDYFFAKFSKRIEECIKKIDEFGIDGYFGYIYAHMVNKFEKSSEEHPNTKPPQIIQQAQQKTQEDKQEGIVEHQKNSQNHRNMKVTKTQQTFGESKPKLLASLAIPKIQKLGQQYEDLIELLRIHQEKKLAAQQKEKKKKQKGTPQKKRKPNEKTYENRQDSAPVKKSPNKISQSMMQNQVEQNQDIQSQGQELSEIRPSSSLWDFWGKFPMQNTNNQVMKNNSYSTSDQLQEVDLNATYHQKSKDIDEIIKDLKSDQYLNSDEEEIDQEINEGLELNQETIEINLKSVQDFNPQKGKSIKVKVNFINMIYEIEQDSCQYFPLETELGGHAFASGGLISNQQAQANRQVSSENLVQVGAFLS